MTIDRIVIAFAGTVVRGRSPIRTVEHLPRAAQTAGNSADLYPGMFVKVGFVVGEAQRLLVPASALAERGEVMAVYVLQADRRTTMRQVAPAIALPIASRCSRASGPASASRPRRGMRIRSSPHAERCDPDIRPPSRRLTIFGRQPAREANMDAMGMNEAARGADAWPAHNGMEHRWGRRIPCGARVRISAGAGLSGSGRMRDVSISGAYIEAPLAMPLFAPVEIATLHDDGHVRRALHGTVTRRDASGVGIEWTETAPGAICPLLGCVKPCAAATEWNRK
jgi:hypothetical protein